MIDVNIHFLWSIWMTLPWANFLAKYSSTTAGFLDAGSKLLLVLRHFTFCQILCETLLLGPVKQTQHTHGQGVLTFSGVTTLETSTKGQGFCGSGNWLPNFLNSLHVEIIYTFQFGHAEIV